MPSIRHFVAATLVFAALPMLHVRADRVDAFVPAGRSATVTVASPGDVATAAFLVQDGNGKKVSITVRPSVKSKLALDVRLVAPDGTPFDATAIALAKGKVKATSKLVTITLPNIPVTKGGQWRVEVRGTGGSKGGATVLVKTKDTSKLSARNQTVPSGSDLTKTIDVGSGQAITVTVKRIGGSKVVPKLQILDPNGDALQGGQFLGSFKAKTATLTLKSYRLPVFGTYTIVVSPSSTTGGLVTLTASTTAAKLPKKKPTAIPGAPTDAEPSTTKILDASASRPAFRNGTLSYRWSQVAGVAVGLSGATTSSPSFVVPDDAKSLGFECAVSENGVWSVPVPVTVEVGRRPVAYAGRSLEAAASAAVTLDGSRSLDRSTRGLTYSWKQDTDDAVKVTLTGANTANPTFTAPAGDAVLHFGLTVDDGALRSFEDFVTVRIGPGAATPDAGHDQFVSRMATVHLSALGTRSASGLLDTPLQWTKVSGPEGVTLNDATSPFPSFQAPKQAGDILFRLSAGGATDDVWVHVRPTETNLAPLTLMSLPVGPIAAAPGNVTLNAGQSGDPNPADVPNLSYRWAQISGPALPPAADDVKSTTVDLPDGNAIRRYAVQAFDGLAFGAPDTVVVRNNPYVGEPVANAGADITLTLPNQTIQLNGSGVLSQGPGPLTYRWRQVTSTEWFDVAAKVPTFDPAVPAPRFNLPVTLSSLTHRRTITMELVVNDGVQDSAPDFMTVTYNNLPDNGKPTVVASANPANPVAGATVQLSCTPFDEDGDPVTVRWTQTSPAPFVTLSGGSASRNPTFMAPASGTFTFKVVANDGISDGPQTNVTVVVDAAPTARITVTPSQASAGTPITIDASASSDPESQPLTFELTQISGATVQLTTSETAPGVWQATPGGAATWSLRVNDGRQNSAAVTGSFSTAIPVDAAPTASVANAAYGSTVTLRANATGTGPFTYTWTQVKTGANAGDPTVSVSNPGAANPTFNVPKPTSATGFGSAPGAKFDVRVTDGATEVTKSVSVAFFASLNDKAGDGLATNETVYGIVQQNCGGGSCHSGSTKGCSTSIGYLMVGSGSAQFLQANNNVTACASGKVRVSPNSSANSYLLDRLKGSATPSMPPTGALSGGLIGLIADWINQGAQDN